MTFPAPWGKLDRQSGARHHLAHHCADVTAAFLAMADLPVVRSRMHLAVRQSLDPVEIERLGVLVFLHDIGKLFPSFQAKGWPKGIWSGAPSGHVAEALDVLGSLADPSIAAALHVDRIVGWQEETGLIDAVLAHHGRPLPVGGDRRDQARARWRKVGHYDPTMAALAIGHLMPSWFPAAFSESDRRLPSTPEFEHLFAGLTALADWLGSSLPIADYTADLNTAYMPIARANMKAQLASVGLDTGAQQRSLGNAPTFALVSGRDTPNSQQGLIGETELNARLVILEAETGSGKTEAALWRYAQLFAAGCVDGLYFAVPTRAAATQLHGRVEAAAKRLFGAANPQAVLAVPGYLRAGDATGRALPGWTVRWDDERDADERRLQARWAAEDSKKYLAAQIAVGTVDQAMLAALLVKHAHVRGAALSRSLLVLDEVHASDRYMTAIQKRLLDQHLRIGGYAMLMSATLGSSARSAWLRQEAPKLEVAIATPYPAVWTERSLSPRFPEQPTTRSKNVAMATVSTMAPEVTAAHALAAARRGARVLVIRNTVARAIETLQAVEATIVDDERHLLFTVAGAVTLHHSRFAPSDRKLLDRAIEHDLKADRDRAHGGKIIVGTQTLEQSLDICADHLITDLCPIDVLLQRIGRLHRHDLPRPAGFEHALCKVLVPEGGLEPLLAPKFENGLGGWADRVTPLQGVYMDLSALELTRRLLDRNAIWTIPAMNRMLVERALHPDAIDELHRELGAPWRVYHDKVTAHALSLNMQGSLVTLDHRVPFAELRFPSDEERIRTRLGGEGARLAFATPQPGPFAEPIDGVTLPAHWPVHVAVDEVPVCSSDDAGRLVIATSKDQYLYDRYGLRRRGAQ